MIYLGSDHAGFDLKESVKTHLLDKGIVFEDLGTNSYNSCDYALIAEQVGVAVARDANNFGLLFCGTGVGISIAANKVKGVRAACCSDCYSSKMTREHNNANILCLGGRVIGTGLAFDLVDIFLNTMFCSEDKHINRINQITMIENKNKGN